MKDIIQDISVFQDDYIPETVRHRTKELRRIELVFRRGKGHLVLLGKTGTGKTLAIKTVEQLYDNPCQYIQCRQDWGQKSFLSKLADRYDIQYNVKKESAEDIWRKVNVELPEDIFVILDDIDRMRTQDICPTLKLVDEANINWVLITNKLRLMKEIEKRCTDVLHRIAPTYVKFSPYNAPELQDIIDERADKGIRSGAFDDYRVRGLLAKLIVQRGDGDARAAIKSLREAANNAAVDGRDKISKEDVRKAVESVLADNLHHLVSTLPKKEKELLYLVLKHPAHTFSGYHKRHSNIVMMPMNKGDAWKYLMHLCSVGLIRGEDKGNTTIYLPNVEEEVRDELLKKLEEPY